MRCSLLFLSGAILALTATFQVAMADTPASQKRMNVLMIAVDDMNNDLGCYGNADIHSPHIDSLAKNGVMFRHAYCQFPLCSPSRTSLLTGLRPDSTGVYNLQKHFRETQPSVITLPQLFAQNDYFVARVGKLFHYGNPGTIGTNGLDDAASWTERYNPSGRDKVEEGKIVNYTPKRGLGSSLSVLAAEWSDLEQTDGMVASRIIELMRTHREEPFFLAAGFYRPHCPYVAPKKYFDLYPIESVKVPEVSRQQIADVPPLAISFVNPWPWFGVSKEEAAINIQAYHACISFVDSQIGRILEALDTLGLADNTVVVFWSDHGYHLGEKGLWKKQSNFERSAQAPMIIVPPKGFTHGEECDRIVEFIDIYPTIAELCHLPPPDHIEGRSLMPLLKNPAQQWDHAAFTQVNRTLAGKNGKKRTVRGESIRTEKWRYTRWDGGAEGSELYDHVADPSEDHNLASDSSLEQVIADLNALLDRTLIPRGKAN